MPMTVQTTWSSSAHQKHPPAHHLQCPLAPFHHPLNHNHQPKKDKDLKEKDKEKEEKVEEKEKDKEKGDPHKPAPGASGWLARIKHTL